MKTYLKTVAAGYIGITSVTSLVMLTTSFELFQEKYLPAFLAGQKYVLPLILSMMSVMYLFFFEPERLRHRATLIWFRIAHILIFGLFAFYVATLDRANVSSFTYATFIVQLAAVIGMIIIFFLPLKK